MRPIAFGTATPSTATPSFAGKTSSSLRKALPIIAALGALGATTAAASAQAAGDGVERFGPENSTYSISQDGGLVDVYTTGSILKAKSWDNLTVADFGEGYDVCQVRLNDHGSIHPGAHATVFVKDEYAKGIAGLMGCDVIVPNKGQALMLQDDGTYREAGNEPVNLGPGNADIDLYLNDATPTVIDAGPGFDEIELSSSLWDADDGIRAIVSSKPKAGETSLGASGRRLSESFGQDYQIAFTDGGTIVLTAKKNPENWPTFQLKGVEILTYQDKKGVHNWLLDPASGQFKEATDYYAYKDARKKGGLD